MFRTPDSFRWIEQAVDSFFQAWIHSRRDLLWSGWTWTYLDLEHQVQLMVGLLVPYWKQESACWFLQLPCSQPLFGSQDTSSHLRWETESLFWKTNQPKRGNLQLFIDGCGPPMILQGLYSVTKQWDDHRATSPPPDNYVHIFQSFKMFHS